MLMLTPPEAKAGHKTRQRRTQTQGERTRGCTNNPAKIFAIFHFYNYSFHMHVA